MLRFCSATIAPTLVFTEAFNIGFPFHSGRGENGFCRIAILAGSDKAMPVPRQANAKIIYQIDFIETFIIATARIAPMSSDARQKVPGLSAGRQF
ncbi:hypothetical protein [Asticcacaulis sp. 201]|uniref:hypothetical protein n=1 Tax=Asticcacaulis sp. 201 TaxID=3028787 RepID=UPI0029163A76|nr:hypothetical protein [Asticcacaulis sp. 201]MDV6329567.1 hypothetical protein [Asticcacaulis sp. 201]